MKARFCFSILVCLGAPTASFVAQQPHSAFLPRRLGVRLGTSYLESSTHDANKVTSAFIRPVIAMPSGIATADSAASPTATTTTTQTQDALDQAKFLDSMDRDLDAMKEKEATAAAAIVVPVPIPALPLPIVAETAADRLARLERRANAMVAKYDAECQQIRCSGPVEVKIDSNANNVVSPLATLGIAIAAASMLLNSPDMQLFQLANLDPQFYSNDAATMLQHSILDPLAAARESIVESHGPGFLSNEGAQGTLATAAKDGLLSAIEHIKSALVGPMQSVQGFVRTTVGELQTTLQNANQALLLTTQDTQTTMAQAQESVLQQVAVTQDLIRTKAANVVVLPSVDMDSIMQQVNTVQDGLLSKMSQVQEMARSTASTVDLQLPRMDPDALYEQLHTVQSSILSRASEIQQATLAKASSAVKLPLPPVDTLALRQQFTDFYGIHSSSLLTKALEETQEQLVRIHGFGNVAAAQQAAVVPLSNTEALLRTVGAGPEIDNAMAVTHAKAATTILMPRYVF